MRASIIKNQNLYTTNSVSTGGVYATVTCPNATSFVWQKTSGNIYDWIPSGANVSFTMLSGGSISFLVTAKNGSTTLATRNVTFYNYGSFAVYPNPSVSSISIDANKEIAFMVILESLDGQVKKEVANFYSVNNIDISTLKAGEYSLRIYDAGKLVSQQKILISK
jgi:hypothetical protein